MSKILIIGAGVMSSAISIPVSDNGHSVSIVGTEYDKNIIKHIKEKKSHPLIKKTFNQFITLNLILLTDLLFSIDLFSKNNKFSNITTL